MSTSPTLKPKKNLVSIGKAAEILGVSIDAIRRWDKAGAIHTYREEGKARRFSLDELREMKASKPLSISEAAIKLGVSASTLRRIEKKGLLVPQRNSIGEREYSRNSIKTYMAREGQQNKGVPLSTNDAIETEIDQIPVPARVLIDNSVYASEKAREFPVYEPRAAGMFASESESARNEVEPRIADAAIRKISRTQYKFNARNIFMATSMLGFIAMLVFGAIGAQTVFNSVTKDRAVAVRLNFEKVDKQPQVLAASTDKGLLSRINDSLSQLLARLPWSSSANKNVSIVAQVKKDAQVNIADVQKALASSAISEKETIYFAIPAVFQKNITAPNVIYSVTAGTGVTITGDTQNPVINAVSSTVASGVSSLQGSTGSVVLTAGSGISIDGLTISSSISSSTEQTFNTISVSGQSDVVADSSTDTLTLTAGTGIVITTDASGDIVTITNSGSSSASGFIDNGTVVSLTTSTDNVTLGSTTDLAKLGIDGEADEIQLLVQGNSTQTTSLIVAENSSGTDVYTVSNTGDVVQTGSLTFSSVGTDITTGSGEDLTVVANGIGIINLNDNVVITGTTDLQGNVSNSTGTLTFADNVSVTGSTTLGDNTSDTITFNAGVSGAGISFASSTFGTCTALETVGGVLTCGTDDTGGAGAWTDGGGFVYLTSSSNNVGVGTTAPTGKLQIAGDTDEIQLVVTGNATQTSNLLTLEQFGGTDVFTVTNAGNVTISGSVSAGSLTVGGDTISDFTGTGLSAAGNTLVTTLGTSISNGELDNSTITFAGDLGSSSTSLGTARTIAGGTNGIDTSDNNAGTLTINFDSTEVGTTTFGSGSAITWTFDSTGGTDTTIAFGSNQQIFTAGTASFSNRLGIGTTAPSVALDVVGAGNFSTNVTATGSVSGASLNVTGSANINGNTTLGDATTDVTYVTGKIGIGDATPDGIIDIELGNAGANWVGIYNNVGGIDPIVSSGLNLGWNHSAGDGETSIVYGTASGSRPRLSIARWSGAVYTEDAQFQDGNFDLLEGRITTDFSTTGSNNVHGIDVNLVQNDDSDSADTNAAVNIDATSSSGDADTVIGLNIANLSGGGTSNEYGIQLGSGWDQNLYFNDTTTNIGIASSGTFAFNDGTNTLFTIVDAGTTGNVAATGNLSVSGSASAGSLTVGNNTANVFVGLQPASSGNSTLEFNSGVGGNISITGDDSTESLEITANGGTGLFNFQGFNVTGGSLIASNNTTLGDATTDTVTLTAKIAGASGSALGFSDGSFTTCTALETVNGMLTCGTDDVGGGAGVWTDGTATAYLAVSSDWVGIGTSTPTDKVNILASTSGSTSFDGLQIDFTQDDDADSADTNAGLNINITSSSSDQDTVLGINIAGITASASAVERGIQIGSGWDSNLYFNDTTTNIGIANSGTFTFNDGTNTLLSIVDAGTTGNVTTTGTFTVNGNTALNGATSIGDTYADSVTFYASDIVLNGGNGGNPDGTIIAFNEALTLADVGLNNKLIISDLANTMGQGANFNFTSANSSIDSVLLLSFGTVTNGVDGLQIDFTQSSDADSADTNAGLNINVTSSSTNADTLLGINIANITGGSAVERGIQIGSGWDQNLYFNDTTTNIGIANSGTFAFNDGTNTLFSIVDAGTTGNVTTTGTFNVNGNTTLGDATTDTVTLTAKIAGASGSALGFSDGSFTTCTALETVNGMLTCGTDDVGGGAGVWTDGTATAYLAVSSDWVGIGTSTPTDKVNILASTSGSASFDGLQIDFTQSDDTDSTDANAGLNINITSSSSDPDTLYGINIATITGGSARETGLNVGSGWDYSALFAGKVGIGTTAPSNVLSVYTTTANDGIYLDGTDRPTIQIASSGVTRARFGVSTGAGQLSSDSVANDVVIRTEGTNLLFNTNTGSSNAALALSSTGTALFKNTTNSTTAFVVQNSGGTSLLNVDTSNNRITLKADIETSNNISSPYGGTGVIGNRLGLSEELENTFLWTANNLTVTANNSSAPDATLTADTLSGSAANSTLTYTNSDIDGAGTYTFSIWLKSNAGNIPSTIRLDSTAGSPTTGTAVSITATTEWKRFSVTQTFTGSPTAISPVITITNSGETIVAWGAQVQSGTSMGVYTPGGTHSNQEAGVVVNGLLRLFSNEDSGGYAAIIFGSGDSNYSTTLSKSGLQVPGNTGDFAFNIDTTDGLFKFQSGYGTALTIKPSAYNTGTGILISGSAPSAVTQTAAVTGLSLNQSTNFTVPNSSAGNQTGINLTIKDGGASATSKGISIQGTADTGISFGGTITNLIDATNFKVSSLGVATLGSANQAGSLVINDGTSSTVTIKSGTQVAATNYDITIPAITGSDIICLQSFANCGGASVWIDGTANAYLSVSSDWVGIGTSTPTDKLNVLASTSGSTSFDGLQIDFTQDDDADSADTNAGLNINITSSSSDQDTVLGINIANITGGSAFERGLQIGSGWDSNLYFNDTTTNISIANSGTFTFNDGTNTLFSIVDTGTNADLIITGGVTFAAFTNGGLGCSALETTATGALNCGTDDTTGGSAPGWTDGGFNVYLSTLNDLVGIGTTTPTDKLNILASTSGSAAFDGLQIDFTLSSDGDSADNNAGLNINLTQSSSDIDTLNGINISITGASASARERGISIGSGFDDDIYFASATAKLRMQNGGEIQFTDNFRGGGEFKDLPLGRLKEYFADANYGVFEAGGFINIDGSYMMDNFNRAVTAVANSTGTGTSRFGDSYGWVVDPRGTASENSTVTNSTFGCNVIEGDTNTATGDLLVINGVLRIRPHTTTNTNGTNLTNPSCMIAYQNGSGATTVGVLQAANKFIMYYKVRLGSNYTSSVTGNDVWFGADNFTQAFGGRPTYTSTSTGGIWFTNIDGTQTQTGTNATAGTAWQGVVRAGTNSSTVTCTGMNPSSQTNTSQWALMRIEARATNDVHFFIDNNVSNGAALTECGSGVTSNIPTFPIRPNMIIAKNYMGTFTTTWNVLVDLAAYVQDDPRDSTAPSQGGGLEEEVVVPEAPVTDPITGADVAEQYGFSESDAVEEGDIVSLGWVPGEGDKASKPYDRKILGAIATSPGLVLGQELSNSRSVMPVAITGRVPVKVSTQNGTIKVGDPITTSDIPGVGMKATNPGKILGTAMESFGCAQEGPACQSKIMVSINVGYYLGDEIGIENGEELGFGDSEIASGSGMLNQNSPVIAIRSYIYKGLTEFWNKVTFKAEAEFWADVVFKSTVRFEGKVEFNNDVAGYAVIKKGERFVDVQFDKEYETEPVVNMSITIPRINQARYEELILSGDCLAQDGLAACQDSIATQILADDLKAGITGKTRQGFMIILNKYATTDMTFSWQATAVKEVKTSVGKTTDELLQGAGQIAGEATPSATLTPTPTTEPTQIEPTPTDTQEPSPTPTAGP